MDEADKFAYRKLHMLSNRLVASAKLQDVQGVVKANRILHGFDLANKA